MARLPVYIFFGQSNMEGAAATVNIPAADIIRLFGANIPYPADIEYPGINYWSCRMPYGSAVSGTCSGPPAAPNELEDAGSGWVVNAYAGKQVILTGNTGAGQIRVIASNDADTLVLERAWTTPPDGTTTYQIYSSGTQSVASYTGAFKKMRVFWDTDLTWTDGYEYTNWLTTPRMNPSLWSPATFGPDLECCWQLQHHHGEDIWVVKLAVGSTFISRYLGNLGVTYNDVGWFRYDEHTSWHPGETDKLSGSPEYGLFDILIETILKSAAVSWVNTNRSGDTLDVRGIFTMVGETDSTDSVRATYAGRNMRIIRDEMRARIAAAGLSSLSQQRIPFIIGGVRKTSNVWPYAATTNAGYQQLATDDPFTGYVDTDDLTVNVGDTAHLDAASQLTFGRRLYEKWVEISARLSDATTYGDRRKSLSELLTLVKRRYERNDVTNDATDERITQFINDAQREFYNTLGDAAWFLRRSTTLELAADYANPATLPREVYRLTRIERESFPGSAVPYKIIGHTDEGRIKITLPADGGGTYVVYFVTEADDLTGDEDRTLIPGQYCELLVVLACRRLAQTAGNTAQVAILDAEAARLWKYVWRDCHRQAAYRKGQFTVPDRKYSVDPSATANRYLAW